MADTGKTIALIKALAKVDPADIQGSVEDWLDDHPEATTTVQDGAITKAKLDSNLQSTVDDVSDLKSALNQLAPGNPMLYWEWIQGGWSDLGQDPPTNYNTNSSRARITISVIAKEKLTIGCKSGYQYCYSVYKDDERVDYNSTTYTNVDKTYSGAGTYTVYITLAKTTSSSDISPTEAEENFYVLADNAVSSIYDAIAKNTGDISAINTATASDVGKALSPKTVSDGKVTEWEFINASGGGSVTVDSALSDTSENPVQNKVITAEINKTKDTIQSQCSGNLSLFSNWLQGGFSDLSQDPPTSYGTGATRTRITITVVASKKLRIEVADGFQICYSLYKDSTRKEYVSSWSALPNRQFEYGAGTYVLYISLAKTSNGNITPAESVSAISILVDGATKVISDAIARLNEQFPGNGNLYAEWLQGGYSNLSNDPPINHGTTATRVRTMLILDVKTNLNIHIESGYKFLYSIYKNGVRQSYESSTWQTQDKSFAYGTGEYTVYVNVAKSSDSTIIPAEAHDAVSILADNAVLSIYDAIGVIDTLKEKKNLYDPGANNTLRGYYNASNTWVTSYDFGQTDYIPVKQGVQYISPLLSTPVLWFDENKDFLQSTASSSYKGWITPPTGAAYVKFMIQISAHTSFYVYSNEPDSVQVPLAVIPYGLYNQYAGKKAVAFGTSLTYRAKSSGGYLEYLPEMAQMTVDNQGLGNSTILEHQEHTDMMGMITGYTGYADKDVVLLEGFVNDWYDNSDKLGTWKDEGVITSTTVCGRIRYAINYILTQNPHTTLIMILDPYGQAYNGNPGCASTVVKSGYTQMEYYDEIAKLAASLGIPTIKGYAISGMNELVSDYYIDIIHPSPLGAKQFANVVWQSMKNIPVKMQSL